MYTGFNLHVGDPGDWALVTNYIRIWKTADFFCTEELKTMVVNKFHSLSNLCSRWTGRKNLHADDLRKFLCCVSLVWKEDREDVRDIFGPPLVGIILNGISYFSKLEELKSLIKEVPDFAAQWALALTAGVGSVANSKHRAGNCSKCGIDCTEDSFVDLVGWMKQGGLLETYCRGCLSVTNMEKWEFIEKTS